MGSLNAKPGFSDTLPHAHLVTGEQYEATAAWNWGGGAGLDLCLRFTSSLRGFGQVPRSLSKFPT